MIIQDFLDHYTLECQKAVSAYLLSEQILHYAAFQMQKTVSAYMSSEQMPFGLHDSRPTIGSNLGSIVYMPGYSSFIARRVNRISRSPPPFSLQIW